MRKIVILLAVVVVFFSGQVWGEKRTTLKIKNEDTLHLIISFGHNDQQLKKFLVWLAPKSSMKIKNWDIDQPTKIFVCRKLTQSYDMGHIYTISSGKPIDVKYFIPQKPAGWPQPIEWPGRFGANSQVLSDQDILVACAPSGENTGVGVTQCNELAEIRVDHDAAYQSFSWEKGKAQREALQKFIDDMQGK